MRKKTLDKLDYGILQAKALFRDVEFVQHRISNGTPKRTLQYRVKKLREMHYLDSLGELTERGKDIVAGIGSLRQRELVESHGFRFISTILHTPESWLVEHFGWERKRLRNWQWQFLRREKEFYFHKLGNTMQIYIEAPIRGDSPLENGLEAAKLAAKAVDLLRNEGWQLTEPVQCIPSHHVFEFLKPAAEAIYKKQGPTDVLDVLIDNSKKNGGEFEIIGMDKGEELLSAFGGLPQFMKEYMLFKKYIMAEVAKLKVAAYGGKEAVQYVTFAS